MKKALEQANKTREINQESNTNESKKYYNKSEKELAQAKSDLLKIENEYRANFRPLKKDSLSYSNENGKEMENPEIAQNNQYDQSFNLVEEQDFDVEIKNWLQETEVTLASMSKTGKKGIIWVLLMHLIKDDEINSGKYNNLGLDKDFCERFLTAYKNRATTPTKFFSKILNIAEGTISSNSEVAENFIKKRFMKFKQQTEAVEFQENDLDIPERINIPHMCDQAMSDFWYSLANYLKKEIEVILL